MIEIQVVEEFHTWPSDENIEKIAKERQVSFEANEDDNNDNNDNNDDNNDNNKNCEDNNDVNNDDD